MPRTVSTITDLDIEHAVCHLVIERRGDPFSTIEIIRKILGFYLCDTGIPASSSPNALFGKRLSDNSQKYRIQQILPDKPSTDDADNQTTTAYWEAV